MSYRMCSLERVPLSYEVIECGLLLQNTFSYYRICSLERVPLSCEVIACVIQNVFSGECILCHMRRQNMSYRMCQMSYGTCKMSYRMCKMSYRTCKMSFKTCQTRLRDCLYVYLYVCVCIYACTCLCVCHLKGQSDRMCSLTTECVLLLQTCLCVCHLKGQSTLQNNNAGNIPEAKAQRATADTAPRPCLLAP